LLAPFASRLASASERRVHGHAFGPEERRETAERRFGKTLMAREARRD